MKLFRFAIIFCLCLMLCSCGKETSNIQQTTGETNNSFISEQETDNFTYEVYNNAYIKITGYNGTEHTVTIPEKIDGKSVTIIGENAFYQKTEMSEILLPSSIETIESGAFYRCYALTSVTIPKTVTQIGSGAFFRCNSLQNIIVDAENSTYCNIDGILFTKDKTKLHTYPEGKTETQYTIPNSVTKIDDSAFGYKTNLKVLSIPSSITELPDYNIFIYPDEITLLVAPNSAAEAYAKEQNIKYQTDSTI